MTCPYEKRAGLLGLATTCGFGGVCPFNNICDEITPRMVAEYVNKVDLHEVGGVMPANQANVIDRPNGEKVVRAADVAHQRHYERMPLQPIIVMATNFPRERFLGYLEGNALKYTMRWEGKGKAEDTKKAKVYLTWLRQYYEIGKILVDGQYYGPGLPVKEASS